MQNVLILGSTGSIGESTLDVIGRHPDRYRVVALRDLDMGAGDRPPREGHLGSQVLHRNILALANRTRPPAKLHRKVVSEVVSNSVLRGIPRLWFTLPRL